MSLRDKQIAISDLISIVSIDTASANSLERKFKKRCAELSQDEDHLGYQMLEVLGDIPSIENSAWFLVDWKDTTSFVDSMKEICSRLGIVIVLNASNRDMNWYMNEVETQLKGQGFALWNWDTGSDYYSGWIAPINDQAKLENISKTLEVGFFPWGSLNIQQNEIKKSKTNRLASSWNQFRFLYKNKILFRKAVYLAIAASAIFILNRLS